MQTEPANQDQNEPQEPGRFRRWRISSMFYPSLILLIIIVISGWSMGRLMIYRKMLTSFVESNGGDIRVRTNSPIFSNGYSIYGVGDWHNIYVLEFRNTKLTTEKMNQLLYYLEQLDGGVSFDFSDTDIRDLDFTLLGQSDRLVVIDLTNSTVSAEQMKQLAESDYLHKLSLSGTKLSEAEWKILAEFKKLVVLELDSTETGDELVDVLKYLRNLRALSVSNTDFSDSGVEELMQHVPFLEVTDD